METPTVYFNTGQALAAAIFGVDAHELKLAAATEAYFQKPGPDYGRMQKLACQIGSNIYRACGREDSFGGHLLEKLADAEWHPSLDPYSDSVFMALGQDKEASAAGIFKALGLGALANTPNAALTAAAVAALGGGSVGSLAWLANRGATHDSAETETTRQRAIQYENLARRIDEEMQLRAPRKDVAEAI